MVFLKFAGDKFEERRKGLIEEYGENFPFFDIRLHVYVGGTPGSNVPQYEIRTNGSNHVFDDTRKIDNNYSGNQLVHIYALNDYGSGDNVEIWKGYVNIQGNNQTPSGDWNSKVGQQLANINSDNYKSANPFYPRYERQCTWYAWGRMREATGKSITFKPNTRSYAKVWTTNTSNCSPCDLQSQCIAVRDYGGDGFGHVVFVEYVDSNYVYYTDDNSNSSTNLKVRKKTISEFKNLYQHFIR